MDFATLIYALLFIVLGLPAIFILTLIWVNSRFPKTNMPMPPGRSMVWGSLPALMAPTDPSNPLFDASFSYWHRKLGKLVCYDVTLPKATRMILLSDLNLIRQIIADDPPKAEYNINIFLGQGLVSAPYDIWRHDRRLLNPAFNKRFLRDFVFPSVVKHATTLTSQLAQIEPYSKTDMNDYFRRMTLDIISEAAMGRDYGFQQKPDDPVLQLMMNIFEELSHREINPLRSFNPWRSFMLHRNLDTFTKHCTDLVRKEQDRLAAERAAGAERKYENGILSVMLGEDEDGSSMPLVRIVDNIKTFLFAGHDTTATLLSFAVGMIATHKEVETKLLAEIDAVLGDREVPTHDDLSRFVYLKMVLKETLRMFPPAATGRRLPVGYQLGEYVVDYPKTDVIISSFGVHHDPDLWPDPEIFDPERFTEANSKGRNPLAFIPFLAGNRNCIGQHLAMLEATVSLAMVYRKFTFRMAYGHVPQLSYRVTNVCANGMQVFVFKRPLADTTAQ
jgi:cytochrome P450